jgi:hypothetical protein
MPDSLDSFSEVQNFYISYLFTVIVLAFFVAVVYYLVLPNEIKVKLIGWQR